MKSALNPRRSIYIHGIAAHPLVCLFVVWMLYFGAKTAVVVLVESLGEAVVRLSG